MTVTRRSGAAGTSTSITTLPSAGAGSSETGAEMGQAAAGQQNMAVDAAVPAVQLPAAMPAALPKSTKSGNSKKGKGSTSGAVTAGTRSSSNSSTTMGQVDVDIAVVDALPSDPVFPAAGYSLQPVDARDALLMLCAKAMASVDNRAITPKEIALICSRKWNWTCSGTQPFAVVSSCIRGHMARAAARGYPPIFSTYELASVPLPEDIPCLGIEAGARPSVKRGTFWFLSEAVGFPSPFPHRRQQGPALASSSKAVSSATGVSAAPVSLLSQGVLKSNGIEEKPLTRAQRVANQNQQQQVQQPQPIAPKPATMPATTAAAVAPAVVQPQLAFLQPAPQINKDPLGRGKRKRTASQFNNALPRASMPGLQQVRGQPALASAAAAGIPGGASATSAASAGHRRAFSSSASDAQKPQRQSLQKLRLRLSAVSEAGPTITPGNSPSSNANLKKASSASRVPVLKSSGSTKQPLSKRARTQSMSQLPSATSTLFPFDNLHVPFLTPHGQPAPEGTVFPLDIHNMPHWPASAEAALDLLTSRSAPEGGIFSPPQGTANVISGPFSRSHSPSASVHLPSTNSSRLASRRGSSFRAFNQAENAYSASATNADMHSIAKLSASLNALDDMDGIEYAEASRSLTDSAILAAQREVLGLLSEQDYHEDMLAASDSEVGENTEGIDFDFETSMDSLAASKRRGSRADDLAAIDSAGEEEDGEDSFDMGLLASRSLDSARRSQSLLDTQASAAEEGNVEKPDAQQDEDWEHVASDVVVKQEEVDMIDEDLFEDEEEYEDSDSEPRATMDSQATYRALNTTLCPAAAGALGRPGKLTAARRLNSSSSLVFTRSPLLRPASISRTNSRDVLNTPVPLAELPVIPLMPPQGLLYHLHGEGERSQGSQSAHGSGASTPLTPVIKSEEETDDFGDATNSSRGGSLSRLPSQALTEEDDSASSSADSFRPEAYVSRGTASIPEEGGPTLHSASRSQSSSRQTSLSPRDSFSPQACSGPHADWALTPPSESEEQYNEDPNEEEEKLLDRATVLGIESVGMDDLEDAWPGSLVRQTADLSVFEPTMEAPPLPAPIEVTPTLSAKKIASAASVDKIVEDVEMVSCTTEDETAERGGSTSSAAMFIAEEEGDLSQSTSSLSSSNSSITGYLPDSNAAANSDGKNTSAPIHVPGSGWFYSPERPFDFPISVLLTETKVLFYSTVVSVPTEQKGESTSTALLRRVDNDAVDGEALLLSLMQKEILRNEDKYAKIANTLANIKHKGNQWISLEFARGLLKEFGEGSHLSTFLADDILLHWNTKLHKLGTIMRQKNGLATPVYR